MFDELLKELVENKLLSEETQKDIKEVVEKKINEAVEVAKKEAAEATKVELTEKWITERDQLIEALDKKVEDFLVEEMKELKGDIESFRDLEVEYAEKLAEHKAAMSEEVKNDMAELLEKLDTFLEMRISVEMEELKEDLEEARRLDFGRRIFEAFAEEFDSVYVDEEGVRAELAETKARLAEAEETLEEVRANNEAVERQMKMDELLNNLDSHQREVMETLLDKVATEKLEEAYKVFLPRIIKESEKSEGTSEKEGKVLAEGGSKAATTENVVVATGDKPLTESEEESTTASKLSEGAREMLKRLSGIK